MRRKGLIGVILTLVVTLFMGICVSVVNAQEDSQTSPFETSYELNETLNIPSREITVNGQSTPSMAVVVYPSGKTMSSSSVSLSEAGVYTVEYRALVNGKTYKESYNFEVDYPAYSLTAKNDSVAYQEVTLNDVTKEGLYVKLNGGSTFTSNQIIDLTKMEKDENFISFYIVPEAFGSMDCTTLSVKLTDAEDETNYITIRLLRSMYSDYATYVQAKAHNQKDYYGVEKGHEDGNPIGGPHGFASTVSFFGYNFGQEKAEVRLSYDNDTQTVYMDNNLYASGGKYVIDFNNARFTETWDGFESGKVRVSVYGEGFVKTSVGFLITSMAQTDLTESTLTLTEPTGVNVDFAEYDENSYPHAVVGQPYRIFDATPKSLYTAERLGVSVKTSYGALDAIDVDIKDECFIPQRAITHTIVYTVTDGFGNVKEYPVPVTVDETYEPVIFVLDEETVSASLGEWVTLPRIINMEGGNGVLKSETLLKNTTSGKSMVITDENYRFVEQGEYVLVYTVKDYNECKTVKEIPVTLIGAQEPIYGEDPVLPITYIKGAKYKVPTLLADDFSSGSLKKVETSAKVYADGTEIPVTDGYFVADGTQITLKYTAKDAQGRVGEKPYTVPVTDVGFGGSYVDTSKYFQAVGGESAYEEIVVENMPQSVLTLKATAPRAEFTFIRELNGKSFFASFKMNKATANYEKLVLRLTDYVNRDKYIEIVLSNDTGLVAVSINGAKPVRTSFSFGNNISQCVASLSKDILMICDRYFTVSTYADGTPFTGFEDCVYFTLSLENCVGEAKVQMNVLNSQSLTYKARDLAPSLLYPQNRCVGEKEMNTTVDVYPVTALDVFDPYTELLFSVITPSGGYATALDGTTLKKVSMDKTYQVTITEYGRYKFVYEYQDSNESSNTTEVIRCNDKVAPNLSVNKTEITGKVGENLVIPEYNVSDNFSEKDAIVQMIRIVTPEELYIAYDPAIGYAPTQRGTYIVRYYVFDENYNATIVDVVCHVN